MSEETEKKSPWLDAEEIKSRVSIKGVLDHYHKEAKPKENGPQLTYPSPFNTGGKATLSVNTERGVWNDSGGRPEIESRPVPGNVIGLVMAFENCSFREALLILHDRFLNPTREKTGQALRNESAEEKKKGNAGFGKELTGLRFDVPLLKEKGLTEETLKAFGVGYCTRGLFKGRVVFPVRNAQGAIMGYAGLSVKENADPKYRFPSGFNKSQELFNIDRIANDPEAKKATRDFGLIVVKGFTDTLKLYQEGFKNVVALMGAELYEPQRATLLDPSINPTRRITLFFDNTETDQEAQGKIAGELIAGAFIRLADYSRANSAEKTAPAQFHKLELSAILGFNQ